MNVFNKVTLQSLKKSKTRTIVTIIGIILSAAMICAVTTFVSSMQNFTLQYAIYNEGDWHGAIYDASFQDYKDINNTGKLSDSTYAQVLGYAKVDSANEFKPYIYVMGGDLESDYFETMPIHLISGRLPKNASEIILPEHLSSNGGVTYKIGDTVTFEIGDRTLDGFSMGQNNPCYSYDSKLDDEVLNDEKIENIKPRTYTVVGIYERPDFEDPAAPGYTALTVADDEWVGQPKLHIYFKMEKPSEVYDFMEEMGYQETYSYDFNTDVLLYTGVSRFDSFSRMLYSLAAIVLGLIMFGSISLIYNAFSISVSERTKQFGLLSSIGATKKQLKKMVFFEALAVSVVGIPLGIIVGIGGIGITLLLIGNKFASLIGGADIPMRICVSWESVVIAIVVALITVLISSWIPSKRATKVSAVEAIRQNMDIKAKNKPAKTSKLTYKLFGLPGVLASKHYKRNKKKYRATVISLFMSIVLFVSASAFTDYLMESVTGGMSGDKYDLIFYTDQEQLNGKTPDEVLTLLRSDKNVTGGAYAKSEHYYGVISHAYVTDQFIDSFVHGGATEGETGSEHEESLYGDLYFVNDTEFMKLVRQYNLNEADYFDPDHPLGIALDNNIQFDTRKEKYVTMDTLKGDKCEIKCSSVKYIEGYTHIDEVPDEDGNIISLRFQNNEDETDIIEVPYDEAFVEYTLRSEKTITEAPFYVSITTPAHLNMIYPVSMLESVLPEDVRFRFDYTRFYLMSDNHAASFENLKTVLTENDLNSYDLMDHAETVEMRRNLVTIIQVFAYGFIVLISLIAAANVFNTISTNISLRRREFAMLKSVGMTQTGFNKMMNFECLLYGSKALFLGLPVSCGVTYLIYLAIMEGYETTFHLPWTAIGIAVLSVFLVVFATMMYSMRKVKKDNPIDALKNENL